MLSKDQRLKKKKDFDLVFKKGSGLKESFLILKFQPGQFKKSRFGIVVSQKVSKKAVVRNKIKRRLRALIRQAEPQFKKRVDVVIITLPGIEKKDWQEIKKTVGDLFQKAKLI